MKIAGLKFIKETSWENVFESWNQREGTREEWQQTAKQKGWESWEEWRSTWVKNFSATKRRWFRYLITNPLETVPNFRVGPTQSWQNNFPKVEHNRHTFATLVDRVSYKKNHKVSSIIANFPEQTEFIGILMPDQIIVVIEGHHRATALAILGKKGKNISFKRLPMIALTKFIKGEELLLDFMLRKGSEKES